MERKRPSEPKDKVRNGRKSNRSWNSDTLKDFGHLYEHYFLPMPEEQLKMLALVLMSPSQAYDLIMLMSGDRQQWHFWREEFIRLGARGEDMASYVMSIGHVVIRVEPPQAVFISATARWQTSFFIFWRLAIAVCCSLSIVAP